MGWNKITDLPPTRLYEDDHGNIRRISLQSGQFVSGVVAPDYGEWKYGETIRLRAAASIE